MCESNKLNVHIQVHQIARNFRDRWIPRPIRRPNYADRDDSKTDFHRSSNNYRFSSSHNNLREQGGRPTEAIDCVKQSLGTNVEDSDVQEGSPGSCASGLPTSGAKIRKRKSRWDQPAEPKEQKIEPGSIKHFESSSLPGIPQAAADIHDHCKPNGANMAHDGGQVLLEDAPPGFSSPHKPSLLSSVSPSMAYHSTCPHMVVGLPQEKFVSRLPVSYGIPLSIMQQFGSPRSEAVGSRVAPGMPFSPFPPLPPFPRDKKDHMPSQAVNHMIVNEPAAEVTHAEARIPATSHSDESSPSTTGYRADLDIPFTNNQRSGKRGRGGSSWDLSRRYFKQQKWTNTKSGPPPWLLNRLGGMESPRCGTGSIGIAKETYELRNTNYSEDLSCKVEKDGNNFYQHSEQHNQH